MNIYFVNAFFVLVLGIFFIYGKIQEPEIVNYPGRQGVKCRKIFCFICAISWIVIGGSRGLSVGADTKHYLIQWRNAASRDFQTALHGVLTPTGEAKDWGYIAFIKFCQLFIHDYQLFLYLTVIMFIIPLAVWIYKNSCDPFISFFVYSTIFYEWFSINLIRQALAIASVIFIGDKFVEQRKWLPYCIVVLIAATIHKSAIILLLLYFLSRIKVNESTIVFWLASGLACFVLRKEMFTVVAALSGYSWYSYIEGNGIPSTLLMIYAVVLFGELAYCKLNGEIKGSCTRFYTAFNFGFLFIPLGLYRVTYYFMIYMVLVLPDLLKRLFTKDSKGMYLVIVSVGLFLILFNKVTKEHMDYFFFWQDIANQS